MPEPFSVHNALPLRRHACASPRWRLCHALIGSLIAHIVLIVPFPKLFGTHPIQQISIQAHLTVQSNQKSVDHRPAAAGDASQDKQKKVASSADTTHLAAHRGNWAISRQDRQNKTDETDTSTGAPARIIDQPLPPEYPSTALARNLESCVLARVSVSALGEVTEVVIIDADIPDIFDESVIASQKTARYYPAQLNGTAVATNVLAVAGFVLSASTHQNCALKYADKARQLISKPAPLPH